MTTIDVSARPALPPCDHQPAPYDGPSREEVLAQRRRFVNPGVFAYYREPLMIVEGRGQYVWDETGRRYVDFFAGILTVSCGHCHPKITQALVEQAQRLQHATTIYLHPNLPKFAARLASKLPEGLDCVYFTNSGSEANDLAITMARLATGNQDVICVRNAYHGGVSAAMGLTSLSTWKFTAQGGGPVHHAINPDPYYSPFEGTPEEVAEKAALDVEDLIRFSTPGQVAAFLAEPIQGAGGLTMGARNYLGRVYEIVRSHGGLCIADEVQTGFGRTGEHFWGFEHWDVVPDIVTMAKGIGNGYPLAAVVTRREIAETLTQKIHFNTFGGNPMAMAMGHAVLEVIEEEDLQRNAAERGARLKAGLERLAEKHALIGDVRGLGLMLGIDLVSDRAAKTPASGEAGALVEAAKEMGLLIGKGGLAGNVVRVTPPLGVTDADVDFALEVIDAGLGIAAAS
ncbi:MAG TPA: aspartate aminotransferase family protein [Thermoanaerobaculia bacterium]|nr:aspartate aminotransferase family protein [Thermoanaerobaculia bacterium]